MRIAIIGGGASGLASAWLLDGAHDVTLFEREPVLGGHVRTLGRNVPCDSLPPGARLDAGVIEFERSSFTAFHAWMDTLGVHCPDLIGGGTSSLFLADGRHLHSPDAIGAQREGALSELRDLVRLVPSAMRRRRFMKRTENVTPERLATQCAECFLSDDDFSIWARSLLMYAYSMHYADVAHISAAIAVPMLRAFLRPNRWTHMPQGVYGYVEAVVASLRGRVLVRTPVESVLRDERGVTIAHDGARERFDALVVAVPPHRVLALLGDASSEERAWFGAYQGGPVTTVVHADVGLYQRRGVHGYSEFDLFELERGHGYNAYLNRLAGLPTDRPPHYSLAFDLESEVDPSRVLHRQTHDVARYTDVALCTRESLIHGNGARRTYFVGAYLGDGLHEGAVRSAIAVAEKLGGRHLSCPDRGSDRR